MTQGLAQAVFTKNRPENVTPPKWAPYLALDCRLTIQTGRLALPLTLICAVTL